MPVPPGEKSRANSARSGPQSGYQTYLPERNLYTSDEPLIRHPRACPSHDNEANRCNRVPYRSIVDIKNENLIGSLPGAGGEIPGLRDRCRLGAKADILRAIEGPCYGEITPVLRVKE